MHNKSLAENEKFTLLNEFNITDHEITFSDISKNGQYVALVLHADSKSFLVIDILTRKIILEKGIDFEIDGLSFSPNGKYIACLIFSKGGKNAIFEVETGKEVFSNIPYDCSSISMSNDQVAFVTGDDWSEVIGIHNIRRKKSPIFKLELSKSIENMSLSEDGKYIAFIGDNETISMQKMNEVFDSADDGFTRKIRAYVYNVKNKKRIFKCCLPEDAEFILIRLNGCGASVTISFSSRNKAKILFYDIKNPEKPMCIYNDNPGARFYSLAISANGKYGAFSETLGGRESVIVYDAEQKKEVCAYEHEGKVLSLCFSSDGKKLISFSRDGKLKIYKTSKIFRIAHNRYESRVSKRDKKERLEFLGKKLSVFKAANLFFDKKK